MSEDILSTATFGGQNQETPVRTSNENKEGALKNVVHTVSEAADAARKKLEEVRTVAESTAKDFGAAAATKASQFGTQAAEKAKNLKATVESGSCELREKATQTFGVASAQVGELQEKGKVYVRENPTQSIVIALGVGFLLGLLVGRR